MFESILENLVTGGIIAGSILAYMRWRLDRLEQCIDRAHLRLDEHLDRKVD